MPCTSIPEGVWSIDSVADTNVTPADSSAWWMVTSSARLRGEPVELVHDAELHPRRSDERQHLFQAVTIRRACRLACVHELVHDPRPEFVGLALVGLTLGGDREPLVSAATLGLLARGDT